MPASMAIVATRCSMLLRLTSCAASDYLDAFAAQHKDEDPESSKDVSVREANKLGRDTRKNIVERALATKDQDQYRFLKLIKDRMDA